MLSSGGGGGGGFWLSRRGEVRDVEGRSGKGYIEAEEPLEALGQLADSLGRAMTGGDVAVPMGRAFSGEPFLDRLYALGVQELRDSGAEDAQDHFLIAHREDPRFLQAEIRLAECQSQTGDEDKAREGLLSALQEAQARGLWRWQANAFEALGRLAVRRGRLDEAEELYAQAFALYVENDDRGRQAEGYSLIARLELLRGNSARAEELLVELLQARRALGDRLGQAGALLELASLVRDTGDLEGAGELLDEALELVRGAKDPWSEMRVMSSLGGVMAEKGDMAAAAELWSRVLGFYEGKNDELRSLVIGNDLARTLLSLGDLDQAEDRFHEVAERAAALERPELESGAALRLAWILLRTSYPRQARVHLDRAIELDRWVGEDRLLLQQLIAWMAYEQGSYRVAFETQGRVKEQAGEGWSEWDEAFLDTFRQAQEAGDRMPLPGEPDGAVVARPPGFGG